jgi:hypothetical protein
VLTRAIIWANLVFMKALTPAAMYLQLLHAE